MAGLYADRGVARSEMQCGRMSRWSRGNRTSVAAAGQTSRPGALIQSGAPGRSRASSRLLRSTPNGRRPTTPNVFGELGFTGSARIAELLVSVLPDPTLPVIDLGCGTGAVGRRLAQLGVTIVDGVDLSPEMLAVAATSGAYRRLTVADLHALDDQPYASYAASVSAGTFTTGHVGPEVVPRLLDLLRPEGIVAWVIATAVWPQFEHVLATSKLARAPPVRRSDPARRTTGGRDVRRPH